MPSPRQAEQTFAGMLAASAQAAHPDAGVQSALMATYRAVGPEVGSTGDGLAPEPDMPLLMFDLGTAYLTAGDKAAAEKLYRLALNFDPTMAIAHQNLSCILWEQGKQDEARAHRELAYREQCIFFAAAPEERRRVLILHGCGYGNVPLKSLIPQQINTSIFWFVEYTTPKAILSMPAFDVIFNAVGDADMDGPTSAITCAFMEATEAHVLNDPRRVASTRRDRLPHLLDGIEGVDVPPVLRVTSVDAAVAGLAESEMAFPVLLRPTGAHGGAGLRWLDGPEGLGAIATERAEAWYLSPVRNCRSSDGYWRKYRMIFVDRQPYPYHLAVSSHWMVHYNTADMLSDPAKCAEEHHFLEDPETALGAAAMTAIRAIGERMDLDYAGVDFNVLPDGRVLVFEANATMLIHPETQPETAYKNPFVQRIVDAFETLMAGEQAAQPIPDAPASGDEMPAPPPHPGA